METRWLIQMDSHTKKSVVLLPLFNGIVSSIWFQLKNTCFSCRLRHTNCWIAKNDYFWFITIFSNSFVDVWDFHGNGSRCNQFKTNTDASFKCFRRYFSYWIVFTYYWIHFVSFWHTQNSCGVTHTRLIDLSLILLKWMEFVVDHLLLIV